MQIDITPKGLRGSEDELSEMTFRGLEIWDLGIMTRVGVRKLGEIDGLGLEQLSYGIGPAPAAPAHGPSTEGAGIRVCGYAIKNSGLIVEVNRQLLEQLQQQKRQRQLGR